MATARSLLLCLAVAASILPASALASSGTSPRGRRAALARPLRASRDLWATIDICNTPHQRNTVGIRGSMPGDGQAGDKMFMRFRLQFMDTTTKQWTDLAGAASGFLPVAPAKSARQAGRSFVLVPTPGQPAFTLRGVVSFQWRRGSRMLISLSRPTSAGHQSLAGAEPPNFSAATCRIG